ncbi:FAD-binding oxidoreductase [Saccharopolyspora sp. NPDC050389]|uniref:FAD-binding oxidoreductase n=1 Tax=Saccharopolyspora sp. NPDC050389 TaxID=3155516 RepID=UPI0033E05103
MTATVSISSEVIQRLEEIVDEPGAVLTGRSSRFNRARVPAPFPVHRWEEFLPDVVVLPRTTEQVSRIVKLANEFKVPIVPRAGGTGLADGAVPMRGGILVDVKRMDQVKEIDLVNNAVTVGPGINMQTLNRHLKPHGVIYPDDPASYACALVGGRIGTSGLSLLGARYGHTRDLVISFEMVLPTGEVIEVGDGGGRKIRKSSTGYHLKHLFMGHQGTLGIVTEATLELVPRAETEFAAFFLFEDYDTAYRTFSLLAKSGLATLAGVMLFDPEKVEYLRRDDEAYIVQPEWVKAVCAVSLLGTRAEVEPAQKVVMQLGRSLGGRYIGDEIASGDWAARHDRYANPLHGRDADGNVIPMSWHCEDAAIPYSEVPEVLRKWHEIARRYCEQYDIFDDWGAFAYTNAPHKPWGDILLEIDMGLWEDRMDEASWNAFVSLKREIAQVAIEHGGSMSACHGATRAGDAELVPTEMGASWEVMKTIKRALDPNNIMNPGKQSLDEAYPDGARS